MLYQHANINTLWLVGVRAWLAGVMFLLFSYLREGRKIFAIFHDKHDLLYGALYGLFGLVGSQLTYFYCVQPSLPLFSHHLWQGLHTLEAPP